MESHTVARWAVTLSGRAIFMGAALLLCSATPALADPCTAIPDRGPVPAWLHKGAQFSGPVAYIGDGDSLCVAAIAGRGVDQSTWVEVRVADFYAPELHEPGGPEAKAALERIAVGKRVECVADHRSYDRVVAVCRLQGESLGTALKRAGAAEGGRAYRAGGR